MLIYYHFLLSFLHLSVIMFTGGVSVPAGTTGHMTRGSLSRWSGGGGLCLGVSVQEGFCLGDLCPGGLCKVGSLSRGSLLGRPSRTETAPYGNERAVRILLECILVRLPFIHAVVQRDF